MAMREGMVRRLLTATKRIDKCSLLQREQCAFPLSKNTHMSSACRDRSTYVVSLQES